MIKVYYIGGPLDREVKVVEKRPDERCIYHRRYLPLRHLPPNGNTAECEAVDDRYLLREAKIFGQLEPVLIALHDDGPFR